MDKWVKALLSGLFILLVMNPAILPAASQQNDLAGSTGQITQIGNGEDSRPVTDSNQEPPPIPEPGTMVLIGISMVSAAGYFRRLKARDQ